MDAQEKMTELRRIEQEILEHEKAVEDLTRQRRELLEVGPRRPDSRKLLSRESRQRFLAGCGSTSKRSQPA